MSQTEGREEADALLHPGALDVAADALRDALTPFQQGALSGDEYALTRIAVKSYLAARPMETPTQEPAEDQKT